MVAILEKRKLRDFDWLLTLMAVAIALFGTWMIYNAQPEVGYWKKQLIGLGVSGLVLLTVAFTDYRKLVNIAPLFYAFGLLLLVLVLIPGIGLKINGQRAWIGVPGLGQFQPSEFMKIPTVLMLARYFGRPRASALTFRETLAGVGILALPVGLIMLEPDAGQALVRRHPDRRHQGLPAGAHQRHPRPRKSRPARLRLPHLAVHPHGRQGRPLGL
jgi:rod shape determining protein RodA